LMNLGFWEVPPPICSNAWFVSLDPFVTVVLVVSIGVAE
jgi:hypothetical protein